MRFIPKLSTACRNDMAVSEEEETEEVMVVEVSSSEGNGAFPFEEVEERNGLPLLRRRFVLDGKRSVVLLDLIISASIALVGVEKRAVSDEAAVVAGVVDELLFRLNIEVG